MGDDCETGARLGTVTGSGSGSGAGAGAGAGAAIRKRAERACIRRDARAGEETVAVEAVGASSMSTSSKTFAGTLTAFFDTRRVLEREGFNDMGATPCAGVGAGTGTGTATGVGTGTAAGVGETYVSHTYSSSNPYGLGHDGLLTARMTAGLATTAVMRTVTTFSFHGRHVHGCYTASLGIIIGGRGLDGCDRTSLVTVTADGGIGVVGGVADVTNPGSATHQLEGVTASVGVSMDGRSGGDQGLLLGFFMTMH